MFEVRLSPSARKAFVAADKPLARKLARCFTQLERDPHHHNNIKSLRGPLAGKWRYRLGDYRVIYTVDSARNIVTVLAIAHRRDVYE